MFRDVEKVHILFSQRAAVVMGVTSLRNGFTIDVIFIVYQSYHVISTSCEQIEVFQ